MATRTKSPPHTRLCDLLGIRQRICQTGIGWVARGLLDGGLTIVSPLARLADGGKPGGGS